MLNSGIFISEPALASNSRIKIHTYEVCSGMLGMKSGILNNLQTLVSFLVKNPLLGHCM